MADFDQHSPRRGRVRGPSEGVEAWATFWLAVADWLITARIRWREGDPAPGLRRSRLGPGGAAVVLSALWLGQRLLGG